MPTSIERVAVIGAGTQGTQIAYRCAVHGFGVALYDVSAGARDSAMAKIERWLAERTIPDRRTLFELVSACETLEDALREADLAIEAVPEDLALKRKVWARADAVAPAHTLLCTNSSSIPSSRMAAVTNRRDRTFSVNFTFPAEDDLMELMWNADTSEDTKRAARDSLERLGMIILESHAEIQGFSFNRVWRAIKKECLHLWAGGYCDPTELDRHFTLVLGTSIAPFRLMDRIGLDVVRDIELSYFRETGDPADRPPRALDDLIEQGHLGVKTGKGFYDYGSEPGTN